MIVKELVRLRGSIRYQMCDADGVPLHDAIEVENLIVEAGRAWIGARAQANTPPSTTIGFCGVGSSDVAPNATQTGLLSEIIRKAIGTIDTTNLTGANPYFRCLTSFGTGEGNGVIAEVGLFVQASGGVMFARGVIAAINKTTSNTYSVTYDIHF